MWKSGKSGIRKEEGPGIGRPNRINHRLHKERRSGAYLSGFICEICGRKVFSRFPIQNSECGNQESQESGRRKGQESEDRIGLTTDYTESADQERIYPVLSMKSVV